MLKMALTTSTGPIGIVGITEDNITRMRAGMPLDIHIDEMTPPGDAHMSRVVVHLAATYEEVLDDMVKGGLPDNEELRAQVKELDAKLINPSSDAG